jgi:hypothetical protein
VNWEAAGAIGEIGGAVAVVITLIYLSKQIRANSTQLEVSSVTDIASLYNEAFMPIYNDEHSMSIWVDGLYAPDALTEKETAVFDLFVFRLFNPFEVVLTHYSKGTLDEATLEGYANRMHGMVLGTPGGKLWLERNRNLVSAEVLGYLENESNEGGVS